MNDQAFTQGFIKRAQYHGMTVVEASRLLKLAATHDDERKPGERIHSKDLLNPGFPGAAADWARSGKTPNDFSRRHR